MVTLIFDESVHIGATPPSDTSKSWVSAEMTEDELFPSSGLVIQELDPSAEVAVKEILIEAGIDIQG